MEFHENPSSGSRVPCGGTEGQTDMTKLPVAFRNFANAPKKEWHESKFTISSCTLTVRVSACLSAQNFRHMLNEATDFTEAKVTCHAHRGHTTDTVCICNITRGNCCEARVATTHNFNSCTGNS